MSDKEREEESDWYTLMSPNGRCVFHFGERKMKHTAEGALSRIFAGVATLYMADEFKAHAIAIGNHTHKEFLFYILSSDPKVLWPDFFVTIAKCLMMANRWTTEKPQNSIQPQTKT